MTTLVLTNDFPPRVGGIESFVAQACAALDDDVAVLTSHRPGRREAEAVHDAAQPYAVRRVADVLLPTPRTLAAVRALVRDSGADRLLVGAAAPLGLLAGHLSDELGPRVAISHGHEVWWSQVPPTRLLLRRIVAGVDAMTTISDHTESHLRPAVGPALASRLHRLAPPVDLERFRPGPVPDGPPTIVTAGRFAARKNHATLLAAFDLVRRRVPDARLLVAGEGPLEERLRAAAGPGVTFVGALPAEAMADHYRAGHVFASPVRSRSFDTEGFGMVFAEAAACGVPVVVGRSGGAPETVVDGVSGVVVDPDDTTGLADVLVDLLRDPDRARRMGLAGREHVAQFATPVFRATLRGLLGL